MEEKQKHRERINYIVKHYEDGKVAYTGQSVNYGCICSSWKSVEDLQKKMRGMIAIAGIEVKLVELEIEPLWEATVNAITVLNKVKDGNNKTSGTDTELHTK